MKSIVIIFGGKSCESDISVITALSVYNAIKNNYHVRLLYLNGGVFYTGKRLADIEKYRPFLAKKYLSAEIKSGKLFIKGRPFYSEKIDCAVVCCHGGDGENGSLSGLLEIENVPYTCCGVAQSAICMDKVLTKYFLRYFRLPTLPFRVLRADDDPEKISRMTFPVILKPASLGSSIGISVAENERELHEKVDICFQFDKKLLAERALIDFKEYTCAVFERKGELICSQIEQVVSPDRFYSFEEKYRGGETKRVYPAPLTEKSEKIIYGLCKKIYRLFELKGVVRIDFLEEGGKYYVNEINTVPGSLSWYLFKNIGYDLASFCGCLIEEGIESMREKDSLFTDFDGNVLSGFVLYGKGKGNVK